MQNEETFTPEPEPAEALHGRDASAQNARRHGLCSEKSLILPGERLEDYNTLKTTCFKAYNPNDDYEIRLVQQLVDAEWFSDRANRTVADVEAHVYNCGYLPINWSDNDHLRLTRFMRYQTSRANAVLKARKAIEDYRKTRTNEKLKVEKHEMQKEKSKPEPNVSELLQMKQRKAETERPNSKK